MGASAPAYALCSVTWGSASADRSITASKPLPRTPVPALRGRAPGHRDLADGAPRGTARLVPPGHGNRRSSEHRAHGLTGVQQPAPLGAPRATLHRDREPGALRSIGPPTPPGQGTGPLRRLGPPPHRDREPDLFGGSAPHPTGTGPRYGMGPPPIGAGRRSSSERRAPRLAGTDTALLGARRPIPPGQGPGPPRRPRRSPPRPGRDIQTRPGNRSSSERRAPGPGTGDPDLLGGPRTPHLTGHRPPSPSGQGHRRPAGRNHGVYATRLGGLAVGNGHRFRPAPGAGQDGNGRKATATVMWCGCWRGELFEGCEPRRGDCHPSTVSPSGGDGGRHA